jgi:hypothetical protein
MKENGNLPEGLDGGIDPLQFPGIWFEQVIQQNVSPQIEGLHIHEVPLDAQASRVAVVLTIAAAQSRAPHQAKDGRYYRRHNFRNQIMEDYEVRDMMRRATTPEPFVRLSFAGGMMTAPIEYIDESEISKPIVMDASIGNHSSQPAFYTLIQLGIDADISILSDGIFMPVGVRTDADGIHKNWLIYGKTSPPNMPVFKEAKFLLTVPPTTLGYHSRLLRGKRHFRVTTIVQTPGFAATEHWIIFRQGSTLKLLEQGRARGL